MKIVIKKSKDYQQAYLIAKSLPEYFDKAGLKSIRSDVKSHTFFGAYLKNELVGFVTYKELNPEVIEMTWLAVAKEHQGKKIGETLVEKSLGKLPKKYKVCEVKTLSEIDDYEPYKKTRSFYQKIGFISIGTINPYPGWGDNPCQIFVRFLNK